tara:strand:- start:2135 stop:2338 length:204 start_codon:yes stop_codon:yes gene_type:complete
MKMNNKKRNQLRRYDQVLCDPIMRSREQTSRSDQMMTVIGEMTVIFMFGAATLAALYAIHAVTFGGV